MPGLISKRQILDARHSRMKRYAYLQEEGLLIFPAQILKCSISYPFQGVTTSHAWFSVDSRKRQVIVSRFEVHPLLLTQLERQPSDNG